MKKDKHTNLRLLLTILLFSTVLLALKPLNVQASSSYKKYDLYNTDTGKGKKQHIGSYWFKSSGWGKTVYISKSKNGKYRKVKLGGTIVTDGKKFAYSVSGKYLYRVTLKTRKAVKLKKFSSNYTVAALDNGYLYVNWSNYDSWINKLYAYNIHSKSFKMVRKDCNIVDTYGDYAVSQDWFVTDVSPIRFTLLKMTSKGIKKVKVLTNASLNVKFIKGKLYWTDYPDKTVDDEFGDTYSSLSKVRVYRSNANGSGVKLMAEIEKSGAEITVESLYSNYFTYRYGYGKIRKYYY